MTVIYPRQGEKDDKTGYPIALLQLALDRASRKENVFLQPSAIEVPQDRVLKLIEQDVVLDVAWYMSNTQREQKLRAIPVPIYKGYFGYRIFLIHQEHTHRFPPSLTAEALKENFIGVQGHDWPDLPILRHNGFNIAGAPDYRGMFDMLSRKRVDFFPRSVLEVWHEEDYYPQFDIVAEENLLLYYPVAVFFFVNKDNEKLARIIASGLHIAIQDGSFDLLFESVQQDVINRSNIHARKVIELENPFFAHRDNPLLMRPHQHNAQ